MTKDEALKLALEALQKIYIAPEHEEYIRVWWPACEQAITAIKEALANEALEKMAENARELGLDYEPAQPFITHNVEKLYDWSEWVCPDPKNYLMKCCDCGLVHEAEFGVVRYKSETEREDCDIVDDPNLQAVFRMRRSEEWTPEDTAHRSGGLPMKQPAQPEQEPVAFFDPQSEGFYWAKPTKVIPPVTVDVEPLPFYTTPPQRTWVGLTQEEIEDSYNADYKAQTRYIEAKLKEKNT